MNVKTIRTQFSSFLLVAAMVIALPVSVHAQVTTPLEPSPDQWMLGKVTSIEESDPREDPFTLELVDVKELTIDITKGLDTGEVITVEQEFPRTSSNLVVQEVQNIEVGNTVVLNKGLSVEGADPVYAITDIYRLPNVYLMIGFFLLCVVVLGRRRGFFSMLGLGLTILVLVQWMIPALVSGSNPIAISLGGALVILLLSLYLAHGFNKRTTIAIVSSFVVLALSVGLAVLYTSLASLSGAGTEDALILQVSGIPNLNLSGLLLAGMIIGVLGVLDDITTGQTAAVFELHKTDPSLTAKQLYKKGFSIGQEHIASLVNTLVLAYAGASLPLLLLLTIYDYQPIWVVLNSEAIVEEIIRTVIGSMALVFAVPITTALAAYVFTRKGKQ